jgi:molecular chaperone DnaK (HSP70)
VGAYSADGFNPSVITNADMERITPSVVTLHRDRLLVGRPAVNRAPADPVNAIFSIKRLMGRRYEDPNVADVRKHVSYRIVLPDDKTEMAHVRIGERVYSPQEVSAEILAKIKADAERALGEEVTHAVITVPAHFQDNQREATRVAGGLAGLKVKRILAEPIAAAYAFGIGRDPKQDNTILVYDLGGGTFDVSIIFVSSGIPTVECTDGDIWLGGDKFDQMIMDYVIERMDASDKVGAELRADPEFMWKLKQAAEQAKKSLGQASSADVVLWGALKGKLDVDVAVRASDFEAWIRPDIEHSIELVERAMARPGFTAEDIDHVLLVGGSTAIPLVWRMLAERFAPEKIQATVDPMECVALGAAIQATRTTKRFCLHEHENEPDAKKCAVEGCGLPLEDVEPEVVCPHCAHRHKRHVMVCPVTGKPLVSEGGGRTPLPYGIGVEGDRFEIIVQDNTPYPTREPIFRTFFTSVDFQERIVIPVYQGREPNASRNEKQGDIVIPEDGPIPEDKRVHKDTPVDVGFTIDENCILRIEVRGKGALSWLKMGKVVRGQKAISSDGEAATTGPPCPRCGHRNRPGVAACADCGEALQGSAVDIGRQVPAWQQELIPKVAYAQVAVRDYDWIIDARKVQELQGLIDRGERAVKIDNEADGRLVDKDLDRMLHAACGGFWDLLDASCLYRYNVGDLDQNQRLGNLLEEYKRRALAGEPAQGPAMRELRHVRMAALVKEIVESMKHRGMVECQHCGQMRQPPSLVNPKCEHCGKSPFDLHSK